MACPSVDSASQLLVQELQKNRGSTFASALSKTFRNCGRSRSGREATLPCDCDQGCYSSWVRRVTHFGCRAAALALFQSVAVCSWVGRARLPNPEQCDLPRPLAGVALLLSWRVM